MNQESLSAQDNNFEYDHIDQSSLGNVGKQIRQIEDGTRYEVESASHMSPGAIPKPIRSDFKQF